MKSEWKTRNVFNYKDFEYGTQASMGIAISKSINISNSNISPMLVFVSINSSGTHRNITLNYSQLVNVVSRLRTFTTKWEEIIIPFNKFNFKIKEVNDDPKLISVFIINNDSDFGNIVFDVSVLISICKMLSSILDNYLDLDASMNTEFKYESMDNRLKI